MIVNADLETSKLELTRALTGMRHPTVTTLSAGDVLFRFASTKEPSTGKDIPPDQWARGSWWFQEVDYRKILQHRGVQHLGTVARFAGAVQPSWSLMNVSIKARLLRDVKVYVGKGSTQFRDPLPNGMYVTQKGWADVDQVYVPGIRGPAFLALHIVRQKTITSNTFGF